MTAADGRREGARTAEPVARNAQAGARTRNAQADGRMRQAQAGAHNAQADGRMRQAQAGAHNSYAAAAPYDARRQNPNMQHAASGPTPHSSGAKKSKKGPWKIILVIAIIVLVCCIGALAFIGFSYWQGQQVYNNIETIAGVKEATTSPETVEASWKDQQIDWEALREINSDIVAWIIIPGTNINYPVVQGTDNSYYLNHDFESNQSGVVQRGSVFLDCRNASDFSDKVNFMYGHHLNDDTMFSAIASFYDQATFDEHRTVYLYTPTANYKLHSFSLVHTTAYDAIVETTFATDEAFKDYVADKISRSVTALDDNPQAADISRVFALSTCDNTFFESQRYILFCSIEEQVNLS